MLTERVLFIDAEAIVLDKPAGLDVAPPARGGESLEDFLDPLRFGFQRRPTPVHRLDRDTSGCLLLARNPKAHKRFSQAFEAGLVEKSYLAVLTGVPEGEEGRIELAILKTSSRDQGWRMVPDPRGKPAVTSWRVLGVRGGRAAVLFRPETGRTHQLRAHAAAALAPIAGDSVYGGGPSTGSGGPPSTGSGGPMLLHALTLRLERPGKNPIEATAPLPPSFVRAGFGDVVG
jgi:tRNA pseudouridine32 synthase / 23S rRNA pseudouridine746 synthase